MGCASRAGTSRKRSPFRYWLPEREKRLLEDLPELARWIGELLSCQECACQSVQICEGLVLVTERRSKPFSG